MILHIHIFTLDIIILNIVILLIFCNIIILYLIILTIIILNVLVGNIIILLLILIIIKASISTLSYIILSHAHTHTRSVWGCLLRGHRVCKIENCLRCLLAPKVGPQDVACDLGCGLGGFCIEAAKLGCQGQMPRALVRMAITKR